MYGKSLEPGNGEASLQVKIVCRLSLVVPAFIHQFSGLLMLYAEDKDYRHE